MSLVDDEKERATLAAARPEVIQHRQRDNQRLLLGLEPAEVQYRRGGPSCR